MFSVTNTRSFIDLIYVHLKPDKYHIQYPGFMLKLIRIRFAKMIRYCDPYLQLANAGTHILMSSHSDLGSGD